MSNRYQIVGGLGSPYSMKMRAVFRYRRIPHVFQMRNARLADDVSHVKPQIIPMVRGPDDADWMVDSTPIIYELEARFPGERSVLPDEEGARFLSEIIEDFGDEWLTKAMFHYRWYYELDRDYSSFWIASDQVTGDDATKAKRQAFADAITERQVGRMPLVGCTEENKPVIERSYERVLDALETGVGFGRFLFGTRPSIGDFGLFGQLKTLGDDRTPQNVMRDRAPTVANWVRQLDDLSGLDGAWLDPETPLPEMTHNLLEICGDSYLPFLAANAAAIDAGEEEVSLSIGASRFVQPPFRYQVKCLSRLRALYAGLSDDARGRVDPILASTRCLEWLVS